MLYLEVGKFYVNAQGHIVQIVAYVECIKGYNYVSSSGRRYTYKGWTDRDYPTSDALVREAKSDEIIQVS